MKLFATLAGITLLALTLTGCSKGMTPELSGLAHRPEEARQDTKVTANQNWRMISDDWYRLWGADHPSRLTPFPITYTSGQPR